MKVAQCLGREQIEQYLQGWTDEATATEFEQHLADCPDCEQTLALVDSETKSGYLAGKLSAVMSGAPAVFSETDETPEVMVSQSSALPSDALPGAPENETPANTEAEVLPLELREAIFGIRQWNLNDSESETHVDAPVTPMGDFGNYELVELVGKGGMAEVYRGRHKRLKRDVAIKVIRVPRWHLAESLARIEREMQAVGQMNHPSIVAALDAGEHNGVQFLVTEFIDGLDVGKIARAVGTLTVADACELVRVAALGLDHAHSFGIVHRDIKPSNLMIDKQGRLKILDFGLVHFDGWTGASVEVTSVGQLLGTLDYMAPEQADRADNVSPRSDSYSLGATLFRLLCGRAPYAASSNQSPLEKLRLLANDRPPRVATLCPELPDALSQLIDRTLARNPEERPSSAAHLAEALGPFCAGADLAGLVQGALLKVDNSPLRLELQDHSLPALAKLVPAQPTPALQTQGAGRSRNIWRVLVGLAMLFAAGFLGIILILETQKGQIVIESDVPNLQVELLANGEVRKEIELVPGENVTRIYAGEYQIRINDGSDRYILEQNTFVLKRGEKVVARISVNEEGKRANIVWNGVADDKAMRNRVSQADPQAEKNSNATDTLQAYQVTGDCDSILEIVSTMISAHPESASARIEADKINSRLILLASPAIHDMVSKTLVALEGNINPNAVGDGKSIQNKVSPADPLVPENSEEAFFPQVYYVTGDCELLHRVVSTMINAHPEAASAQIVVDKRMSSLIVHASPGIHDMVKATLALLDGAQTTSPPKSLTPAQEPMYDGKTTDEWLNILKLDHNANVQKDAMNALTVLNRVNPKAGMQLTEYVVDYIADGDTVNESSTTLYYYKLRLSEEHIDYIESKLNTSSFQATRKLMDILLDDAIKKSTPEAFSRFQQTLETLGNRPELFTGAEGENWSKVLVNNFTYSLSSSNPDNHPLLEPFLTWVLDAEYLGPKYIIGLVDSSKVSIIVFNRLQDHEFVRKLMFIAAFRALEAHSLAAPEYSNAISCLGAFLNDAPEDLREKLPHQIDDYLGVAADNEVMLGTMRLGVRLPNSNLIPTHHIVGGRLQLKIDLDDATAREYLERGGSSKTVELIWPVLDLLNLRARLDTPLDERSLTSIRAVQAATASKSEEFFGMIRKQNEKEVVGDPAYFDIFISTDEFDLVKVGASWTQPSDAATGDGADGADGGAGQASGNLRVVRRSSMQVPFELAMAAIIHEQAQLLLDSQEKAND